MNDTYTTIKDAEGALRPMRYITRADWHGKDKIPKLNKGESFIEVELKEKN